MRKILFAAFLLLSLVSFSQTNTLDSAWVRDNYVKWERFAPMRDGKKLYTAIYFPKDSSEKHPILLRRTPYSAAPYGENNFPDAFWNNYWRLYLREGYIMVVQDVRGRYLSEGDFVDVRPFNPSKKAVEIDEASDTYDAVDWLVKNVPGNNGRVGVFGISYPGFYATMAALSGHPAVKAVSPQAPVTDWFMGDDFHHNGAFMLMDAFAFYSGFGKPRPVPTVQSSAGYPVSGQDNYDFYLRTGTLKDFARLAGDSIAFWKDLYAHPNLDDWWKARNTRNFVQHIPSTTNTLVVGGLFDAEDVFGAWNLYRAIETKAKNNNKLVMGPWFHGQWGGRGDGSYLGNVRFGSKTSEWYQNNVELPFFNYHLKGKGNLAALAEATVFFSGENKWRQLSQWPPAAAQTQSLYLQSGGGLGWRKPAPADSFSSYNSYPNKPVPYTEDVHLSRTREYMTDDQRFAARRPDVLVFETGVLQEDVTLAGPLNANLFVSLTTTDADFVVKLIDVFPDTFRYADAAAQPVRSYPMAGYQMLVRGEVMRGKYRNSFEKPEPFTPGKVEEVKFYLPDVAHTFKKGHRMMVQIQSSWFPLVDRNPQTFVNIYEATPANFQKAGIRIYHNERYPSHISAAVVK